MSENTQMTFLMVAVVFVIAMIVLGDSYVRPLFYSAEVGKCYMDNNKTEDPFDEEEHVVLCMLEYRDGYFKYERYYPRGDDCFGMYISSGARGYLQRMGYSVEVDRPVNLCE